MSGFPQELDYSHTPHFLFEVGSLMVTIFGFLFALSVVGLVMAMLLGYSVWIGLVLVGVFGLSAMVGVGVLYSSILFHV